MNNLPPAYGHADITAYTCLYRNPRTIAHALPTLTPALLPISAPVAYVTSAPVPPSGAGTGLLALTGLGLIGGDLAAPEWDCYSSAGSACLS